MPVFGERGAIGVRFARFSGPEMELWRDVVLLVVDVVVVEVGLNASVVTTRIARQERFIFVLCG